jgi:hypothetical protein
MPQLAVPLSIGSVGIWEPQRAPCLVGDLSVPVVKTRTTHIPKLPVRRTIVAWQRRFGAFDRPHRSRLFSMAHAKRSPCLCNLRVPHVARVATPKRRVRIAVERRLQRLAVPVSQHEVDDGNIDCRFADDAIHGEQGRVRLRPAPDGLSHDDRWARSRPPRGHELSRPLTVAQVTASIRASLALRPRRCRVGTFRTYRAMAPKIYGDAEIVAWQVRLPLVGSVRREWWSS